MNRSTSVGLMWVGWASMTLAVACGGHSLPRGADGPPAMSPDDASVRGMPSDPGEASRADGATGPEVAFACPWVAPTSTSLRTPLAWACGDDLPAKEAPLAASLVSSEPIECGDPGPDQLASRCFYGRLQMAVESLVGAGCAPVLAPYDCGELDLAVRDGVVVDASVFAGFDSPCLRSCLAEHLVGQRFSCTPRDGWVMGLYRSCTIVPP